MSGNNDVYEFTRIKMPWRPKEDEGTSYTAVYCKDCYTPQGEPSAFGSKVKHIGKTEDPCEVCGRLG